MGGKKNRHFQAQSPRRTAGKHDPCGYADFYKLVTHRQSRSAQDLMHRTHLAAFYLSCLKKTDYFADSFRDGGNDDDHVEMFVGTLLLHHLMVLQFNAFEVSELRRARGDDEQQQTVFIGGSVYPTLALFNHSCDPCVVRWVM